MSKQKWFLNIFWKNKNTKPPKTFIRVIKKSGAQIGEPFCMWDSPLLRQEVPREVPHEPGGFSWSTSPTQEVIKKVPCISAQHACRCIIQSCRKPYQILENLAKPCQTSHVVFQFLAIRTSSLGCLTHWKIFRFEHLTFWWCIWIVFSVFFFKFF